jgi:hypothetical protein
MLHVRDCPGTTASFDVCPFPWCRKVKHLLYHLVSCQEPEYCAICSPIDLAPQLVALHGLNEHRFQKFRELLSRKTTAFVVDKELSLPSETKIESTPVGVSATTVDAIKSSTPPTIVANHAESILSQRVLTTFSSVTTPRISNSCTVTDDGLTHFADKDVTVCEENEEDVSADNTNSIPVISVITEDKEADKRWDESPPEASEFALLAAMRQHVSDAVS